MSMAAKSAGGLSGSAMRMRGIGLMMLALFCFTCIDTLAKWLGQSLPTIEVVWARYMGALVFVLILFNPWRLKGVMKTRRPLMQAFRSTLLMGSTTFNFIALLYLQLDQTVSIMFATPFLVAALSGPMLGEWVGPRRWAAIIVGFIGVLVITNPFSASLHWAMGLVVLSTFCYAIYTILTRKLAGIDSAETTSIYSVAFGALVVTPVMPFVWVPPSSWAVVAGMCFIGCFGAIGHWFLIKAHNYAPAGVLSPFIYTQIIWMTLSGYLFFQQTPAANTLVGSAIVIASGLYLIYRERVVRGEAGTPTVPH